MRISCFAFCFNRFDLRERRGFTLIELLTVVAMVLVLAVMSFPALGFVKERGLRAACIGNLRACGAAILTYAADNNGILPPSTSYTYPQADASGEPYGPITFTESLRDYIPSGKIFYCPSAADKYDSSLHPWSKWSTNGGNVIQYQYYGGTYRKRDATGWNSPAQCADRVSDPGNFLVMGDIVGRGNPSICPVENMSHMVNKKVSGANILFLNGSVVWYPFDQLTVSPASDWLIPDIPRPQ
jgi:prepilin-type N-terminal cleavage/methylation domain-containing protein